MRTGVGYYDSRLTMKPGRRLIKPEAEALVGHLCSTFKVTIHRKDDATIMKYAAIVVELTTGTPAKTFLSEYATTLADDIYIPDKMRADPEAFASVIVHEVGHSLQMRSGLAETDGDPRTGFEFAYLYLLKPEARARYEALRYLAQAEFLHARFGIVPTIGEIAHHLDHGYALGTPDLHLVEGIARGRIASIRLGVYTDVVAREAIAWLRKVLPDTLAA